MSKAITKLLRAVKLYMGGGFPARQPEIEEEKKKTSINDKLDLHRKNYHRYFDFEVGCIHILDIGVKCMPKRHTQFAIYVIIGRRSWKVRTVTGFIRHLFPSGYQCLVISNYCR